MLKSGAEGLEESTSALGFEFKLNKTKNATLAQLVERLIRNQ
jgi:hypothetical protein